MTPDFPDLNNSVPSDVSRVTKAMMKATDMALHQQVREGKKALKAATAEQNKIQKAFRKSQRAAEQNAAKQNKKWQPWENPRFLELRFEWTDIFQSIDERNVSTTTVISSRYTSTGSDLIEAAFTNGIPLAHWLCE